MSDTRKALLGALKDEQDEALRLLDSNAFLCRMFTNYTTLGGQRSEEAQELVSLRNSYAALMLDRFKLQDLYHSVIDECRCMVVSGPLKLSENCPEPSVYELEEQELTKKDLEAIENTVEIALSQSVIQEVTKIEAKGYKFPPDFVLKSLKEDEVRADVRKYYLIHKRRENQAVWALSDEDEWDFDSA